MASLAWQELNIISSVIKVTYTNIGKKTLED